MSSVAAAPEGGEPVTVVLGQAKLDTPAGTQPILITQTLPVEESPRQTVRHTTDPSGAPAIAREVLLQHNQSSVSAAPSASDVPSLKREPSLSAKGTQAVIEPPVREADKLLPPAKVLDAPLDTIRPEEGDLAPSAAAAAAAVASGAHRPHALEQWDRIAADLKGKQVVVFLDYDGTLTPIVSVPSQALISAEQRARLADLAAKFPVSIVTGRTVPAIKNFLMGPEAAGGPQPGLEKLYFAGSHGFDISCPASAASGSKRVAEEYLPLLRAFHAECAQRCASIPGSICEDNTFSISIHYRNVAGEKEVQQIEDIVTNAIRPYEEKGQLQRHRGKMVHEIRPKIEWHKGAAVDYLLRLIYPDLPPAPEGNASSGPLRLPDGRELAPVYIGDDTTDEDAFRVLRRYGREGQPVLTVFVRTEDKARDTEANYVLRDPNEVGELLARIAKL